jgi:COP9 signalosome complex subunit 1
MGNEDLGQHFEKTGNLDAAAEAYNRMRQDVTTTKHIIDCGIHLVNVYIARRDWTMVLNNLGKIIGVQSGDEERTYQPYTKLVSGIALLGLKHYKDAANNFLQVDFTLSPAQYNHIASPNDIAVYGGLLALATMERNELQTRVLDNQSFRSFLENESHIRKAISLFVNGRYSNCLAILESVKNDYLLDVYLQRHIATLYSQIRNKCIIQYFIPFSCVTLESLNKAFAPEGESVETELVAMIREGSLKARLDAKNKVSTIASYPRTYTNPLQLLIAVQPNPRLEMQKQALEVSREYEQEAKDRLRRMNIIAAGLEVVGKRQPHSGPAGRGIDEQWFDDARASGQQGNVEAA